MEGVERAQPDPGPAGTVTGSTGTGPPGEAGAAAAIDSHWLLPAVELRRLRLGEGTLPGPGAGQARHALPVVAAVSTYSRVRGGPTAFGLRGRIVATLLLLASVWVVARLPFGQILLWMVMPIVLVVGLRGIWHAERQPTPIVLDRVSGREPRRQPERSVDSQGR